MFTKSKSDWIPNKLYRNLENLGDIELIWIWYRYYVVVILMHGTILLQYRYCIITTSRDNIVTIYSQWNILSTSFWCCYYDDDFFKKIQFFFTISILCRHDIATTLKISSYIVATFIQVMISFIYEFDIGSILL